MKILTLFLILTFSSNLTAQGLWVKENELGPIGISYYYPDVGSNCIIKIHSDSSALKTYESVSDLRRTFWISIDSQSFNHIKYYSLFLDNHHHYGLQDGTPIIAVLPEDNFYAFNDLASIIVLNKKLNRVCTRDTIGIILQYSVHKILREV